MNPAFDAPFLPCPFAPADDPAPAPKTSEGWRVALHYALKQMDEKDECIAALEQGFNNLDAALAERDAEIARLTDLIHYFELELVAAKVAKTTSWLSFPGSTPPPVLSPKQLLQPTPNSFQFNRINLGDLPSPSSDDLTKMWKDFT